MGSSREGVVVAVCAGKLGENRWNMPCLYLSANDFSISLNSARWTSWTMKIHNHGNFLGWTCLVHRSSKDWNWFFAHFRPSKIQQRISAFGATQTVFFSDFTSHGICFKIAVSSRIRMISYNIIYMTYDIYKYVPPKLMCQLHFCSFFLVNEDGRTTKKTYIYIPLASKSLKFVGFNPKPRVSEILGKYIRFISETSGFTTIWRYLKFCWI